MSARLETPEGREVTSIAPAGGDTTRPRLASVPALAEVYRRHASDVARWAGRLGGPRIDVDDVIQEVFIIAARRLAEFRGEAKLTTWLFRITDRVVRNHRRWARVRRILTRLTAEHGESLEADDAGPLETLERKADARDAYRILDELPEKYRRVLILFELEELPSDEIAGLLGARVETIRVWLHRARRLFLERQQALERRDARRELAGAAKEGEP